MIEHSRFRMVSYSKNDLSMNSTSCIEVKVPVNCQTHRSSRDFKSLKMVLVKRTMHSYSTATNEVPAKPSISDLSQLEESICKIRGEINH